MMVTYARSAGAHVAFGIIRCITGNDTIPKLKNYL